MYQCHGIRTDVVARLPSDPSPSQASSLNTVLIAEILKTRKRIIVIYSQSSCTRKLGIFGLQTNTGTLNIDFQSRVN